MTNRQRDTTTLLLSVIIGTGLLALVAVMTACKKRTTKVKPNHTLVEEEIPVLTRSSRRSKYFLRSRKPTFSLKDNYGAGDCLFNCFVQAVRSLQENVSVQTLRAAVAKEMDEEKLKTLKMFFDTAVKENDHDMLADYQWMQGVQTVDDLKRKIKSRAYYGDEMALPVLERVTGLNATIVKHGGVQRRMDEAQDTNMHILLVLKHVHYRIVALGQTLVFNSIPDEAIRYALKQS